MEAIHFRNNIVWLPTSNSKKFMTFPGGVMDFETEFVNLLDRSNLGLSEGKQLDKSQVYLTILGMSE